MKNTKTIKAWLAIDSKGKPHLWLEGRYAVYKSTHGKAISLQRAKQPDNFIVVPCTITYQLPPKKTKKV